MLRETNSLLTKELDKIIVSLFQDFQDTNPTEITLPLMMDHLRNNEYSKDIQESARAELRNGNVDGFKKWKTKSPSCSIATVMKGGHAKSNQQRFTGLSYADFDHLDPQSMDRITTTLQADNHTLFEWITISAEGIRVGFAYEFDVPPQEVTEAEYHMAWEAGNKYFSSLIGLPFDPSTKDSSRLTFLNHDPKAYFNPHAVAIKVNTAPKHHKAKAQLSNNDYNDVACIFAEARNLLEEQGIAYADGHNNYLMHLVPQLNRMGVVEADTAHHCLLEGLIDGNEDDTRKMVKRLYETYSHEHGILSKCFGVKRSGGSPRTFALKDTTPRAGATFHKATPMDIQQYIADHCQIIHNVVSTRYQYFDKEKQCYLDIDDTYVNSLRNHIFEDLKLSLLPGDVWMVIQSDNTPLYDPFATYFEDLPAWDGHDYIADLCNTVSTPTPELFRKYFTKWIVASVRGWMGYHVNQMILELIGRQNIFKSTFFQYLLPPPLQPYYEAHHFNAKMNKDDRLKLVQNGLICLDEMRLLSDADNAVLKQYATTDTVEERLPYAHTSTKFKRRASLCCTGNEIEFLNDPTGNRRHLPFLVNDILSPIDHPFDYEGLYSQAWALAQDEHFKSWVEKDDEEELREHQRTFTVPNEVEEAIQTYFRKPTAGDYNCSELRVERLSATAIRDHLTIRTNNHHITAQQIGQAMRTLGYESKTRHGQKGYNVVILKSEEIENQRKNEAVDAYYADKKHTPSNADPVVSPYKIDSDDDLFSDNSSIQ